MNLNQESSNSPIHFQTNQNVLMVATLRAESLLWASRVFRWRLLPASPFGTQGAVRLGGGTGQHRGTRWNNQEAGLCRKPSDDTEPEHLRRGREQRPRSSWSHHQEAGRKMPMLLQQLLRGLRNICHHPGKARGVAILALCLITVNRYWGKGHGTKRTKEDDLNWLLLWKCSAILQKS